jgi:Fe-S cluster assembly protein SufD
MTERSSARTFVEAFAGLDCRGAEQPSWLRDLRRTAIERFADRGLPTTRDEEWKYTSLAPMLEAPLEPELAPAEEPEEEAVAPFFIGGPGWHRLVFVNGRYSEKLSSVRPLPPGVRLASLLEALASDAEALRSHLAREAAPADAFAALNAASWRDGAYLSVPSGTRLREPVQLLFVARSPEAARAEHPRTLIVLGPNSEATVVESYAALGPDVYLTNAVTDVELGDDAGLEHAKVEMESPRAFHIARTRVRQGRDSRFASTSASFGGRLVRQDAHVRLAAEGATSTLSGLFVIGGVQHVDTHTVVDHAAPRATSRQLWKGVLDGRARGVFDGRVVVRPGANGTDAQQTNKNLLLSDGAEVASKPQLEIFADDVKVSHGAADGQVAEEAVFYLKSRGLDEAAARTLLTYGFANEVLGRIGAPAAREWLQGRLMARLERGRVVADEAEAEAVGAREGAAHATGHPEERT